MSRFIAKMAIITVLIIGSITNLPTKTSAGIHLDQQVTCYHANSLTQFPARSGYKYVLGVTAASQYKVYNSFTGGPRIPFGTTVTLSDTVNFPYPAHGVSTNKFRIDDMGDKFQTRTPYFVDVFYGAAEGAFVDGCIQFGTKRMTVTF